MQDYYTRPAGEAPRGNSADYDLPNNGFRPFLTENVPAEHVFSAVSSGGTPVSYTPPPNKPTAESLIFLRPEQLRVSGKPDRSRAARNAIIRLSESIKRYGMIEPLPVRPADENGYPCYELVGGEHQYRAACLAGVQKLPCTVLAADDLRCTRQAVMASLREGDRNMFEQAGAFRLLLHEYHLTQEDIAHTLGVSQSTVANKLRLLRFSAEERRIILENGLTERHARALLRLQNPADRLQMLRIAAAERLNVAQTEARIEALIADRVALAPKPVYTAMRAEPRGSLPRKFALQDLTPLYNSIEKTLAIFRKTGADAECVRRESEEAVEILIRVPKHA